LWCCQRRSHQGRATHSEEDHEAVTSLSLLFSPFSLPLRVRFLSLSLQFFRFFFLFLSNRNSFGEINKTTTITVIDSFHNFLSFFLCSIFFNKMLLSRTSMQCAWNTRPHLGSKWSALSTSSNSAKHTAH